MQPLTTPKQITNSGFALSTTWTRQTSECGSQKPLARPSHVPQLQAPRTTWPGPLLASWAQAHTKTCMAQWRVPLWQQTPMTEQSPHGASHLWNELQEITAMSGASKQNTKRPLIWPQTTSGLTDHVHTFGAAVLAEEVVVDKVCRVSGGGQGEAWEKQLNPQQQHQGLEVINPHHPGSDLILSWSSLVSEQSSDLWRESSIFFMCFNRKHVVFF